MIFALKVDQTDMLREFIGRYGTEFGSQSEEALRLATRLGINLDPHHPADQESLKQGLEAFKKLLQIKPDMLMYIFEKDSGLSPALFSNSSKPVTLGAEYTTAIRATSYPLGLKHFEVRVSFSGMLSKSGGGGKEVKDFIIAEHAVDPSQPTQIETIFFFINDATVWKRDDLTDDSGFTVLRGTLSFQCEATNILGVKGTMHAELTF